MAPRYGDGEAESVIGETFDGRLPDGVRASTKHRVSNPPAAEVPGLLEAALDCEPGPRLGLISAVLVIG